MQGNDTLSHLHMRPSLSVESNGIVTKTSSSPPGGIRRKPLSAKKFLAMTLVTGGSTKVLVTPEASISAAGNSRIVPARRPMKTTFVERFLMRAVTIKFEPIFAVPFVGDTHN